MSKDELKNYYNDDEIVNEVMKFNNLKFDFIIQKNNNNLVFSTIQTTSNKKYVFKVCKEDVDEYLFLTRQFPKLKLKQFYPTYLFTKRMPILNGHFRSLIISEKYGMDFEKIVRQRGPIEKENDALKLLNNVLKIVNEMHSNKFVMRDVKPANYVVTTDSKISSLFNNFKLIDFGNVVNYFYDFDDINVNDLLINTPFSGASPMWASRQWSNGVCVKKTTPFDDVANQDFDCVVYFICFMFVGTLPWINNLITASRKSPNYKLQHKKMADEKFFFNPKLFILTKDSTAKKLAARVEELYSMSIAAAVSPSQTTTTRVTSRKRKLI